MKKIKLHDGWFRLLGIPLIAFTGHIIFYNRNDSGDERFGFWGIYLLSLAETIILWESNRVVIRHYRKKFPSLQQTQKRITKLALACSAVTILVRLANLLFYDETRFWGYRFPLEGYLQGIFVALLFVVVVGGVYEAIYYFRKWKDTAVEAERLKKENLQTQLDSLKSQISPHFLFNSLGSLSSLIEEDPKKAQDFVGEMSTVYRYVLQANEQELTSLKNELEFIRAYMSMLLTRFPDGLQLAVHVDPACEEWLLPPLTLQILVENAVKHNAVFPHHPLQIKIATSKGPNLVVRNNIQLKTSPVYSSKKGLANISRKYQLLNQPGISVKQESGFFLVTIPLIKRQPYAGTYR